jgi:ketosteroid isomerase-like protein
MTPTDTMIRYFETWRAHDFDAFEALLADDVSFRGPLGAADDAKGCRAGIEGMSKIVTDIELHAMAATGEDVVTVFDMHTSESDEPSLVANWAQVRDGRIQRIRVTFDPRPLL